MSKFTFGTPTTTTASTGFGFGAAKPTTASFGTPASGTLTFGNTSTPATNAGLNFSFGSTPAATTTQTQPVNLTLGAPTTTTGLSLFSTPTTTAAQTGLTFGATPASTGNISFGATTTTSAPTFGTPATTTGISFGTSTGMPTLNFGGTTNTATVGAPTFGATTTTTPSLFGSGSLFGAKRTATTAITTASTTTPSINRGLGGLDVTLGNKGLSQGSSSPAVAKENLLPNELMQTIEGFKEFVKTQKVLSSDIARGSVRPLNRCAEDTASLMELLTTLAGSVQRDRSLADKLKQDTAKALQNIEIAQRTHDTPPGLQYENNAPLLFFMELAENFEQDLMLFRQQIEATEKHIQTMMTPKTLTPQELTMTMNKLHESFIAIAAKLQKVHQNVQQKKEQYLNFRKYVLKDNTNVFEDAKSGGKDNRSSIAKIGLPPLDAATKSFLSSSSATLNPIQPQQSSYVTQNPLVQGHITAPVTTNMSMVSTTMKPPTASLTFNPPVNLTAPLSASVTSSSFQLQEPPIGNKRMKQ